MNTALALIAIGASVVTLVQLVRRRGTHRAARPDAQATSPPDVPPSTPTSDWQQLAQRTHHGQIEALRDWMGEDHELVRQLHHPDTEPAKVVEPTERQSHGRLV